MVVRVARHDSTPVMIPAAVIISTAPVIAATVIIWPAPAPKRPRINIHIRVNRRALLDGGCCRLGWWFAGGTDQSVEHRVTGSRILQGDNLVGGQRVAGRSEERRVGK